jgi:hypothetical protein
MIGRGSTEKSKGGVAHMDHQPTVKEMERALGLDECGVIVVNSGDDAQDMSEKGDAFAEWYEEELRERYERFQHRTTEC